MKKRGIWLILVLTAALLTVACGASAQDGEPIPANTQSGTPEPGLAQVEADMPETVLVDNDSLAVTVTGYEPGNDLGPAFTLLLENRTASDLYFTLNDVSVNDVMNDPLWGENVPAGERVYSLLFWPIQDLTAKGINYIEEIEGVLWVYDAGDYSAEDIYEDVVVWSVRNSGTELPAAEEVVFADGIEDMELLATGEYTAVIKDYSPQGEWGPTLTFYLENNTDATVLFLMSSVTVNGTEFATHWTADVRPGKVAYSPCYWWQEELDESRIEDIETMSFTFYVVDLETRSSLEKVDATVSLVGDGAVLERNITN